MLKLTLNYFIDLYIYHRQGRSYIEANVSLKFQILKKGPTVWAEKYIRSESPLLHFLRWTSKEGYNEVIATGKVLASNELWASGPVHVRQMLRWTWKVQSAKCGPQMMDLKRAMTVHSDMDQILAPRESRTTTQWWTCQANMDFFEIDFKLKGSCLKRVMDPWIRSRQVWDGPQKRNLYEKS